MAKVEIKLFNKKVQTINDPQRKKSIPNQGFSAFASSVGGHFYLGG